MTNENNAAQGKHLESLAAATKRYILAQILDVTDAVIAELGTATPSGSGVLDTVPATVDGGLWYELDSGKPVVKIYYGGHDYSLNNSPGLTVELTTSSEISYGTTATATVTYRGAGTISVSASDSNVTPAYSDGTITIPWAAVTGSITITVSLAADGTYAAEGKSFTVSMLQNNPELTVTPVMTTLNLAGTTASVTRNGSGAISVASNNENVTPTVSGSTITIPYAVFDENTNVTFSVSVAADSGYAADTKTFTVNYVSPCIVNMPFDTSITEDLAGGTWTVTSSPTIVDNALYLDGSSYLTKNESILLGGQDFTVCGWCKFDFSRSDSYSSIFRTVTADNKGVGVLRYGNLNEIYASLWASSNIRVAPGNDWFHFELVCQYSESKTKFFINGTLVGTISDVRAREKQTLFIGREARNNTYMYLNDFKVYDGVALHTENFTPPARSST